jgi:2-deoxy-D-gluconate 3-dehydrogenase
MAVALAEAGADVALVARHPADAVAEHLTGLSRKSITIAVDVAAPGAAQAIVERTLAAFGRLDILVNNAGVILRGPFLEFSGQQWDEVLDINLKAVFTLSQAAARVMARQRRGKIINVASMLSYQGGIRTAAYTASKSAVLGLTRLMACELAPLGINTNAVAPGYIATDATRALQDDPERNKTIIERIPAGRWGTPADLQGAVVFLASRAADYVNGFTVAVDGGWLAR